MAQEKLDTMTTATDHLYAVFTKGAVSRVPDDELWHGNAYADKLYSEPGDQVTLSAWGDSWSQEAGGVKYYKFSHWTDAAGNTLSTERHYTVTVQGMDIYYAHFTETTEDDYKTSGEKDDPHKSESYYDSSSGISEVTVAPAYDGRLYDLHGRRVAVPGRGLYIRNGRKFFSRQ